MISFSQRDRDLFKYLHLETTFWQLRYIYVRWKDR